MDELFPKPYSGQIARVPNPRKGISEAYIPEKGLVDAVNLSIFLRRPLLVKGEPGCGKTRLARAVAWDLYGKRYNNQYDRFYFEWHIQSISKAREGLYRFDYLNQLRDTQIIKNNIPVSKDEEEYVKWGVIGKAFQITEERPVILIDEIDKADIDFPNDLLLLLDERRFFVEELPYENQYKEVVAKKDPIVIITSNNEKELPPAFLRRCLFYYLDFPGKEKLEKIISGHFEKIDTEVVEAGVKSFSQLRDKLSRNSLRKKKLSTSELIDWFKILANVEKDKAIELLISEELPFSPILLKSIKEFKQYNEK